MDADKELADARACVNHWAVVGTDIDAYLAAVRELERILAARQGSRR